MASGSLVPVSSGKIQGLILFAGGLYVLYGAVSGRLAPMLAALFTPSALGNVQTSVTTTGGLPSNVAQLITPYTIHTGVNSTTTAG